MSSDNFDSLLPPSMSIDQRFVLLEQLSARLNSLDLTPVLTNLVDLVGADVLPWLGEQFSLYGDGWELTESEDAKRALIKRAIEIHRHKGTPWSIKETLKLLGYPDAQLIEGGSDVYPDLDHWFEYSLIMANPILNAPAQRIRNMLANIAPARCVLSGLDFTGHPFYYNGELNHDGAANYGVA